jgi:hypothetical protein
MDKVIIDNNQKSTEEEKREFCTIERAKKENIEFYQKCVAPALDIIKKEHDFSEHDVSALVKGSKFIPVEYEKTFAKGIYYFLRQEQLEASRLLILQIEKCLRHLLSQDEPTRKVKNDGSEESETNIPSLLKACVENGHLSNNEARILRIYLTHKLINLRHKAAHGLIDDKEATDCDAKFLCYMILCIVLKKQKEN